MGLDNNSSSENQNNNRNNVDLSRRNEIEAEVSINELLSLGKNDVFRNILLKGCSVGAKNKKKIRKNLTKQ
jgi:hypothetical protein